MRNNEFPFFIKSVNAFDAFMKGRTNIYVFNPIMETYLICNYILTFE